MTEIVKLQTIKVKVVGFLIISLSYLLLGLMSTWVAIPPGYAAVVWPAAGLALLAALYVGVLALPAIVVGATLLNYIISFQYEDGGGTLLLSVVIGVIAAFQAYLGRIIILSSLSLPLNFSRLTFVARFIIFGALISSLTGATLSNIVLWSQHVISDSDWFHSWVSWYVGDAIGIVFTVPWLLVLLPKTLSSVVPKGSFVFKCLVTIGACTAILGILMTATEKDKHKFELAVNTDVLANALTAQLDKITDVLQGVAGFVRIQHQITPMEFRAYTQGLLKRNKTIYGLSWNERVYTHNLAAYTKEMASQYVGFDDDVTFKFSQFPAQPETAGMENDALHVIVSYVEPTEQNYKALGLDIYSQASRKAALEQAWFTHQLYPTSPIDLVQGNEKQKGVLVLLPAGKMPLSSHAGYATAILKLEDLGTLAFDKRVIGQTGVVLFDPDVQASEAVLYAENIDNEDITQLVSQWREHKSAEDILDTSVFSLLEIRTIPVGGHHWILMQVSRDPFLYQPWGIHVLLAGAVLFAGLLGWFVIIVAGHTDDIEFQVERRTNALTQVNERLVASERAQAEAVKEAKRSNQAKSEFLANMSHEIRTPLNAILGLSRLGLNQQPEPGVSEKFRKISHSGELLLAIINDILDFSKIEAQKLELETVVFSVPDIISQLRDLFIAQADAKGIALQFKFAGKPQPWLKGDSLRLRQILVNLLSNAIKFTPHGCVCLTCRFESVTDKHCICVVDVTDTGIGMTQLQQKGIFDAFIQADSSTSRKYGGTGLGMSISHRLAIAMGGSISCTSKVAEGSQFCVRLPMVIPPDSEIKVAQYEKQRISAVEPGTLRGHVLVVEDNEINQEVVGEHLRQLGMKVSFAQNGALAVIAINEHHFDLILMDIQMPVMDGYRAARKIREQGFKTPIIALTAAAMVEDRNKALACGMNDHLSKPFTPQDMYRVLVKWLKNHSANS
ncbi:response regulator [Alteromonas sp. 14N.309.X.WAT.G.H12]|uniref:response regulator n=1 Tax=Alteromonas sp. 14N.309.X.WAT.G.H12 TaxID=3120824 RepID=UPI002FD53DEF